MTVLSCFYNKKSILCVLLKINYTLTASYLFARLIILEYDTKKLYSDSWLLIPYRILILVLTCSVIFSNSSCPAFPLLFFKVIMSSKWSSELHLPHIVTISFPYSLVSAHISWAVLYLNSGASCLWSLFPYFT